jgi:ABC-type branched-subunit amino acid transport system ATPase component
MSALLEVESVSVSFGGTRALVDANLTVLEGELHAVIGPNGSGKSTLLNVISRLITPQQGRVRLRGSDMLGERSHTLAASGVARVFQTPVMFAGLTAFENIMVGMQPRLRGGFWRDLLRLPSYRNADRESRSAAEALAERVGIPREHLDLRADRLTFVQQRRIELARALAAGPELLLLDEPAGGLNSTEIVRFRELIQSLRDDRITIVLVEHNVRFVRETADRVTVLDHGSVLATGGTDVFSDERVVGVYVGGRAAVLGEEEATGA